MSYRIAQNFGGFDGSRLSANHFNPSYFAVQGSQSTHVLSAKMYIGSNPPKFCAILYIASDNV